jgi:uncharacterized protein (TIGR02145 family)
MFCQEKKNCKLSARVVGFHLAVFAVLVLAGFWLLKPNVSLAFTCGDNVTFNYRGNQVTYDTVTSTNNVCWMDRNLGANATATAYNDGNGYGDLFQWGRLDDGHQATSSVTTSATTSADIPGHNMFITVPDVSPWDWHSPQNNNLWATSSGNLNNPCPAGWRVPTNDEWSTEEATFSPQSYVGAYNSPLKLTAAGYRNYSDGQLFGVGTNGVYWSSTVNGANAWYLYFYSADSYMSYSDRANGLSVRCLQDSTILTIPSIFLATGAGQTININNNFTTGDGTNAVKVTGNTYNPILNISGNLNISTSSTLVASSTTWYVAKNWTNLGTFNSASGTVNFYGSATSVISGANTFWNLTATTSNKVLQFATGTSATTTVLGALTLNGGDCGTKITLLSTQANQYWYLNAMSTVSVAYVDVKDSNANGSAAAITATNSTDSGNNVNWDISACATAIAVSGKVYSNEGTSALLSGPIVNLYVNSTLAGTTTASTTDGSYSIPNVLATAGQTITVYLDNNAATGTTVTVSQGTNLSGLDIYQNHIIVRNDKAGAELSIADMSYWDKDNDPDIKFTATTTGTDTLVVDSPYELYVWGSSNGKFKPNGNVTTYDLKIASSTSVYTASGTEAISVGGNWWATSSANFVAASSTVTFTSTVSTTTITTGGAAFYNLTFNGSNGVWTFQDAATTTNDLTITAGTASSSYNMYVYGGDVTGNGTLNWASSTFMVDGTGNFGGTPNWNFYNLTFGNGAVPAATTTAGSTGTTTVSNVLTIAANQTLNAGSKVWEIDGASTSTAPYTPFLVSGTFNASSSTFRYTTSRNTNIAAATYYNLNLEPFWSCGDSITDVDGNIYNTTQIGTQCWMTTNMRTTKYPNVTNITRGPTGATWDGNDNSYYACPPNTANNAEDCTATSTLGYVYQWSAAMNGSAGCNGTGSSTPACSPVVQGICPSGWHMPSHYEITLLEKSVGSNPDAFPYNTTTQGWLGTNEGTNLRSGGTSGFNVLLAGQRSLTGDFYGRNSYAYFWSSTLNNTNVWARALGAPGTETVYRSYDPGKAYGYSVRCIWNGGGAIIVNAPVYTLATTTGQALTVNNNLLIGDGVNPVTVTATSNNPTINVDGNLTISGTSTFAAPTSTFTVAGNWTNSGTFTAGSSTVTFNATTTGATGKTISGNLNSTSSFYKLTFNGTSSAWTITDPIRITAPNATSTFLLKQGTVTLGNGPNDNLEVLGGFIVGDGSGYATFTTAAINNASGTITININASSSSPSSCLNCIVSVATSTTNATSTFWLRKNAILKFNSAAEVESGLEVESMGYLWIEGERMATNTVSTTTEDTASTTLTVSGTPFTGLNFTAMHLRIMSTASSTTAFGKIYDIASNTASTIRINATTSVTSTIQSITVTSSSTRTICSTSTTMITADNEGIGRYLYDHTGTTGYFKIVDSTNDGCSGKDSFVVIAEPDSFSALAATDVIDITDGIKANDTFEILDYAQVTANATSNGYIWVKSGSETLIRYADIWEMGTNTANKIGVSFYSVNGANTNEGVTIEKSRVHDGGRNGIYFNNTSNNNAANNKGLSNNAVYGNANAGLYLYTSSNNILTSNNSYGNYYGFAFNSSANNTLTSNNSYGNGYCNFYLYFSNNNTYTLNNSYGNNAYGFMLYTSSNNTLTSNNSYWNGADNFIIYSSSNNNTLASNNSYGNNWAGFSIDSSSNNNTLISNNAYDDKKGISISGSIGTIIIGDNYGVNGTNTADISFGDGPPASNIRCYSCNLASVTTVANVVTSTAYFISFNHNNISTSTQIWGEYFIPIDDAETPQNESVNNFSYATNTWQDSIARVNFYDDGTALASSTKDTTLQFDFGTGFLATSATYRVTYTTTTSNYWIVYRNETQIGTTTNGTQFNDSTSSLKFTIDQDGGNPYTANDTYTFTAFKTSNNANQQKYLTMMQDGDQFNVPASTTLNLTGQNSTASTTRITRSSTMSSGGYNFNIYGTINAQYYRFDYLGGDLGNKGLYLTASSTVTSLDDGYFDNFASTTATDTYITVATGLIGSGTPSKTIYRITFMNTATTAEYNVSATGTGATGYWNFYQATGTFAGESYDYDISSPGEIRWSGWGIIISGTVFTDEGTATTGAARVVRIKINGEGNYSDETDSNGIYSVSSVVINAAGDTITVYLDAATTTEKANTITIASSTADNITGLDLYQNRIIVTHPTSTPLNIANLAQYTNASDTDILFSATSSTGQLTASSTSEFFVWQGKTYNNYSTSAAGTASLADLDNNGTFNASTTQTINISSSWDNASGTFNAASSTVAFTSTATGKTILGNLNATSSFYKLYFNGTNGGWTIADPIRITAPNATSTLVIKQGTVTLGNGPNDDLEVLGGFIVGDGSGYATFTTAAINNASGTITININASSSPVSCPNCIVSVASSTTNATSTFYLRKNAILKFNSASEVQSGLEVNSMGYLHIEGEQIATNTVSTVSEDAASTTINLSTSPYTADQLNGMHLRISATAATTTAIGKIYDILDTGTNWINISATSSATGTADVVGGTNCSSTATCVINVADNFFAASSTEVGRYLYNITDTKYYLIVANTEAAQDTVTIATSTLGDLMSTLDDNDQIRITDGIKANDTFEILDYAQVTANATSNGYIWAKQGSETIIRYADISENGTDTAYKYGISFYSVNGANSNEGVTIDKSRIHGGYNGVYATSSSNNTNTKGFSNNAVYGNTTYGFGLNSSSNNTLTSNNGYGNQATGIYLGSSPNNTLTSNQSYGNNYGIYLNSSSNNSLTSNLSYNNKYGGIYLIYGSNNILTSNQIFKTYINAGIVLEQSNNNVLTLNRSYANDYDGIWLFSDSNNNILNQNESYGNYNNGIAIFGIGMLNNSSDNNTLSSNKIHSNSKYGLFVFGYKLSRTIIINDNYGILGENNLGDIYFENQSGTSTIICYKCLFGSATTVTNVVNSGDYFVSFNHNQLATSTKIWGEYSIPADNTKTPQNESINNFSYATNTWPDSIARVNYYGTGNGSSTSVFDFSGTYGTSSATYRVTYSGPASSTWYIYRNETYIATTSASSTYTDNYNLRMQIATGTTAYATSDTYTFTAFKTSNNANQQKYLTMMQDADMFTAPANTILNIQGGGSGANDISIVNGTGTYWGFYNNSGNELIFKEATINLARFYSGTTTVLNTTLNNESVTSTAILNADWYLGAHIIDKDDTAHNVDTGAADITISESTGSSTVWKWSGSSWLGPWSATTTGTLTNGQIPDPATTTTAGAIRIREYSRTGSATTTYKYNLAVVSQPGFSAYNYYNNYGSNYLTSSSSVESANVDKTIYKGWQRNIVAAMNGAQPYDGINEAPQHGSWYIGMSSDLQASVDSGTVNLGTLYDLNIFTATATNILTSTTSYSNGFTIKAYASNNGRLRLGATTDYIIRWNYENLSPALWSGDCTNNSQCGFGYTTSDASLYNASSTSYDNRFLSGTKYAGFATTTPGDRVGDSTGPAYATTTIITYRTSVLNSQIAGDYTATIYYVWTPNY